MFLTEITLSRLPQTTDIVDSDRRGPSDSEEASELDVENSVEDQDDTDSSETPTDDPNKAGLLRVVPMAHLVYKRAQPDGTFSELWSYKSNDVKATMKIRNNILAGTDIEKSRLHSADNTQSYDVWSVGNIEILEIIGLPN